MQREALIGAEAGTAGGLTIPTAGAGGGEEGGRGRGRGRRGRRASGMIPGAHPASSAYDGVGPPAPPEEEYDEGFQFNLREIALRIVTHPAYTQTANAAIFANTLVLCLYYYPMPIAYEDSLNNANLALTIFFCFELLAKLLGMGVTAYLDDYFNIFDMVVVIVSVVELALKAGNSLSGLRAVRVLRIIRSIKSWKSLQRFLVTCWITVQALAYLAFLFGLVIFIFALLGERQMW